MQVKRHALNIAEHETTGWLVATADGLPGFFVQGSSLEQIRDRAPRVLARYLERQNIAASDIAIIEEAASPDGFHSTRLAAEYQPLAPIAAE
ncbi:MAG TPA: hypothetical protein DF715_03750 [Oceanicaulis sp.]|jgi:predicted RNase H-like HicB family nuclease|uniref:Uncharacterized protein n=1 Tax=Glycocaulis albus TaxID=1382801 RepID=A0ABQ1XTL6_9PROT|nr:hypothetical protein [Glycocaulis albus]GGH02324.1 hypothetical protein GCM10007420_18180 [Glycocaulis albus]HCY54655.1 hypothetical protein [Oceanicaulis sp.]